MRTRHNCVLVLHMLFDRTNRTNLNEKGMRNALR